YEVLAALPGIGPYTAGAIASIAFGLPVPAVDGNVTRVISRLFRIRSDVTRPPARRRLAELAADLVSVDRAGAFNQAMMELGATICTPVSPACERCPVKDSASRGPRGRNGKSHFPAGGAPSERSEAPLRFSEPRAG